MIYIADDETLLLPMLNGLRDDTSDKLDTSDFWHPLCDGLDFIKE